jgi:uncharacterized membrane protein
MRTPASIAHHPIHPMLVPIPIGLWVFSFICDLIYHFGSGDTAWLTVATYDMVAGIVGALLAAVFGFRDMLSLHGSTRTIALTHMAINLSIVALYVINAWMRIADTAGPNVTTILSLIAILLLLVSGWLGGQMVYVHQVAVTTEGESPAGNVRAEAVRGRHAKA